MKKDEIEIGAAYTAKVSGNLTTVVIEGENAHGGWDAINTRTGKQVRIKSPQRLRRKTTQPRFLGPKKPNPRYKAPAKSGEELKAVHKADQENARLADERAASADGQTASERAMAESAPRVKKAKKATKEAKAAPKRDTGERGATGGDVGGKPMSLLDAAAHLLSLGTGAPMRCKDIVDLAVAQGLWATRSGKTPANTLYAAIGREINAKGDASRFQKVERGQFALRSKS